MPTILRIEGFRLFFFSNERQEPKHIHVEAGGRYAKFWLEPVELAQSVGFNGPELTMLRDLVLENQWLLKERWDEFFSR